MAEAKEDLLSSGTSWGSLDHNLLDGGKRLSIAVLGLLSLGLVHGGEHNLKVSNLSSVGSSLGILSFNLGGDLVKLVLELLLPAADVSGLFLERGVFVDHLLVLVAEVLEFSLEILEMLALVRLEVVEFVDDEFNQLVV